MTRNTTTVDLSPASPYPAAYVTPECAVGRSDPTFKHGCPSCPAPGYTGPHLGRVDIPCACAHHTDQDGA